MTELANDEMIARGRALPCDTELLDPLGRVAWAAISLHHVVRDCLVVLDPEPKKPHFRHTLGQAVEQLKSCLGHLDPSVAAEITRWCDGIAEQAIKDRNGVVHAVTATVDGRQRLGGSDSSRPPRYTASNLLHIAGALSEANRQLSTIYYRDLRD